ncbi:hypothetical protein CGGC5_v009019 [Colletotrichum fructicola Nara gc5]|uniref:Uncharacterized protein n=1 Tax=Colletotrichum fructicola (strain Nara gc5) TaxID=1213859 RepID=A0A7J6J0F8_COLFN|nr:hypothetical protein CGGC5_v009019 [Colletotrichum fructicola Nara gc5]KAF5508731.1 hypothetical protein CGCF413_v003597 [Colletotrichum fructicola]
MSSDNDVEKDGSSAVINKTDDGDRAASFSSRARSYSSDTWCGPFRQAGNTGIRQDGHSNGAGGEHAAE